MRFFHLRFLNCLIDRYKVNVPSNQPTILNLANNPHRKRIYSI